MMLDLSLMEAFITFRKGGVYIFSSTKKGEFDFTTKITHSFIGRSKRLREVEPCTHNTSNGSTIRTSGEAYTRMSNMS
jgi:hypothetical protein